MKTLLALFLLASLTSAEEYMCRRPPPGCPARIVRNGQIETVMFRKGDIISTEAGWIVSPEDGWNKIKNDTLPQAGKLPAIDFWIMPPISASPVPNMLCLVGRQW